MKTINLNTTIDLSNLTDHGKKIYQNYIDNIKKEFKEQYNIDHKYEMNLSIPLWEVMQIFGEHVYNGSENFVENCTLQIK